ncbi:MAG TPA: LacI family DNA-binding transcriptional regulator [Virgibacillus sp.]|nr:LacI family DNA-binding transcriptional regulator [Virgibacillus sp.]HLR69353.1 LacI family DNA-binding transcriptional regulator [Virgibacillus sp.]
MSIKLKDIADKIGVSPSTISKVINNKPGVGDQLRQEILQKVQEMNLRPKKNVGGFLKEDTINIQLFIRRNNTTESDPFYSLIQEGISQELQNHKINLLLYYLNENSIDETTFNKIYQTNDIKGNILIGADFDNDFLSKIKKLHIPTVLIDNFFPGLSSVNTNNSQGALLAIEHLTQMGHKQIAFLSGPLEHKSIEQRNNGYLTGLNKFVGKRSNPFVINSDGVSVDDGYNSVKNTSLKNYTAIFAATDKLAIGAIKALREEGIKVPDDISIIGFDDIEWGLHTDPSLTSINIPKQQIGIAAARLFLNLYDEPELNGADMKINTSLIQRHSVKILHDS